MKLSLSDTEFSCWHYIRFDQRYENPFQRQLYSFSARARYKAQAKIRPIKEPFKDVYFPLAVEFFMELGKGLYFNDVMRITSGIGYDFNFDQRIEFHLSYSKSRNSPTESFANNDIVFRLRFFQIF